MLQVSDLLDILQSAKKSTWRCQNGNGFRPQEIIARKSAEFKNVNFAES
jgi:hypothetical protein